MNVLMIGASDHILRDSIGDVLDRHVQYANGIGKLFMIVYSPRKHQLQPTRVRENFWIYPTGSRNRLAFLWDAYCIGSKLCKSERIDLITTQDPFATGLVGLWLKWRFSTPLEVQSHSSFYGDSHWRFERPLFRVLHKLGIYVLKRGDLLRVLNRAEEEAYVRLGIPKERIRVLPTPVHLERFLHVSKEQIQSLRRQLQFDPTDKVVLWVGRMVSSGPNKRLDLWLQAAQRIATQCGATRFLLVGDGPQRQALEQLTTKLSLQDRVVFTGFVPHEDLPAYYHLGDVYLHTSSHEGFGKVLVEAQAAGLTVVAVRAHGPAEIVLEGKTGYLYDPDPTVLAERVVDLLINDKLREDMGQEAQQWATTRYNREAMIEAIVNAWRETAARYKN